MKNCNPPENQIRRRILPRVRHCSRRSFHGLPAATARPRPRSHTATPCPTNIQVPAGNEAFLEGHAVGTQNYVCQPSGSGFAWTLFTPQATLFSDRARQVTTHFFSPNPFENGTIRATWQHSRDTSTVWGKDATSLIPTSTSSNRVRFPGSGLRSTQRLESRTDPPVATR